MENGKISIKKITKKHAKLLDLFISNCGKSEEKFTYFKKRNTDVLENHILTLLLLEDNSPVAYGHLDKENETTWLGVCVIEKKLRKGYGKLIMRELLAFADQNKININLSVMKENLVAHNLYKNLGFKNIKSDNLNFFMKRKFKVV
jgi:GNAT superfamily N-acetyltransferase